MNYMVEFFCRHCSKAYYLFLLGGKKQASASVICPWCNRPTPTS